MSIKNPEIQRAMWAGDLDRLNELAPCICCCGEHTFPHCPARIWDGCRSGLTYGDDGLDDRRAWAEHYAKYHNLSTSQFYGEI